MQIEIDQSWKIEDTNKKSVVAFSNGISASLLIPAKEKKVIQQLYRQAGKPEIFVYKLFSVLIFILVKDYLGKIDSIAIDTEYPGKEALIKEAYAVFKGEQEPTKSVKSGDIVKYLL